MHHAKYLDTNKTNLKFKWSVVSCFAKGKKLVSED